MTEEELEKMLDELKARQRTMRALNRKKKKLTEEGMTVMDNHAWFTYQGRVERAAERASEAAERLKESEQKVMQVFAKLPAALKNIMVDRYINSMSIVKICAKYYYCESAIYDQIRKAKAIITGGSAEDTGKSSEKMLSCG